MSVFYGSPLASKIPKHENVVRTFGSLKLGLVLLIGLALTLTAKNVVVGQSLAYDIFQLDEPSPDTKYSIPTAMDIWGNVVGNFRTFDSSTKIGFFFDRQTESYVYFEPGQVLTDTNNFGQLVGGDQSYEPDAYFWNPKQGGLWVGGQALYWNNAAAVPIPLTPCDGHLWTGAAAINDMGLIVGLSYPEFDGVPGPMSATIWQVLPSGVSLPLILPGLPGHLFAVAEGISEPNGNGVCTVVGQSGSVIFEDLEEFAVRWKVKVKKDGKLILKEGPVVLGTAPNGSTRGSTAFAATSKAFVTGTMGHDAFKRSNNGTVRLLKFLKYLGVTSNHSAGLAIDESKNIVGQQAFTGLTPLRLGGDRATLWPGGKAPIDLNTTVELPHRYRLFNAIDINSSGEILAYWAKEGAGSTARPVVLIPKN